ncbi:MAG TPA: hypothetical protein VHD38_00755 [Candidatus Paceibacterota bacterium]|nr:hypothetical protein [Candidatus Paceibacterota bacterium]
MSQIAGILNIFVGLMLVAAFLLYFGALIGWAIRLGVYPSYRDEMIHLMMWANAVLFVLVVLLAIVHFLQSYLAVASFLFGILIFFGVIWLIVQVATAQGAEDEH